MEHSIALGAAVAAPPPFRRQRPRHWPGLGWLGRLLGEQGLFLSFPVDIRFSAREARPNPTLYVVRWMQFGMLDATWYVACPIRFSAREARPNSTLYVGCNVGCCVPRGTLHG